MDEPTSETMAPGFKYGAISGGDARHRADGCAQDDEVRVLRGLRRAVGHRVDEVDLLRARTDGGVRIGADDDAREVLRARDAADRGADQAEADDDELLEQGLFARWAEGGHASEAAAPFLLPLAGEGGPTQSGRMRALGSTPRVGHSLFLDLPHPTPLRGATFSREREKEGLRPQPRDLANSANAAITSRIASALPMLRRRHCGRA